MVFFFVVSLYMIHATFEPCVCLSDLLTGMIKAVKPDLQHIPECLPKTAGMHLLLDSRSAWSFETCRRLVMALYYSYRPEEYISENVYTEYVKTSSAMSDRYVTFH